MKAEGITMTYSDKLKEKAHRSKENTRYMKLAREEQKRDKDVLKLVAAGTISLILGGAVSIWKITSDNK